MKTLAILPLLFLLAGCVTPIVSDVQSFDVAKLSRLPLETICQDYATYRDSNKRAEGKSRSLMTIERTGLYNLASPEAMTQLEAIMIDKGITPDELEYIRRGEAFIGMSKNALYAAWEKPYKENQTITANTLRIQHVYTYGGRHYAYTQSDIVTALQN
jgi:hypothetical protein